MFKVAFPLIQTTFGLLLVFGAIAHSQTPPGPRSPSKPDAKVFFLSIKDGATVPSKFTVYFGVAHMEIAPASVFKPFSGHHHLIIDSPLPPLDKPIPSDSNHLHFGHGQTEAEIILPAGEHTLQLLLGDQSHIPHDPPVVSEVIHVTVDPATVEKPRTPSPANATVFFAGLEDGATLPPKSNIKFGLSGIELAPAGINKPDAGHHHLIIDSALPDLDREIPNDPNHLHFGRGQSEAEITLTPGPHTLQLLLGDFEHVPHDPPIMSKMIHVTVVEDAGNATASTPAPPERSPSPPDAAVYFIYPTNGALIYPNSTIRFGLRNMGVAPAGIEKENTGHHYLLIDTDTPPLNKRIPSDVQHLNFGGGETEKKITLKPGRHTLQLVFGDYRNFLHDPPVISEKIVVNVVTSDKRRHR